MNMKSTTPSAALRMTVRMPWTGDILGNSMAMDQSQAPLLDALVNYHGVDR
jgi:hypothetical protein